MLNTSSKNLKKVAVIGTGVIGTGWSIRLLAHNTIVYAYDKDFELHKKSIEESKRTWPHVRKFFGKTKLNLQTLKCCHSLEEATREDDFIQEYVSEHYLVKTNIMKVIGKKSKMKAIISHSTYGTRTPRI